MSAAPPAVLLAALNDTPYRIVLLLHILAVIVAFAPVIAHAVQTMQARSADSASRARMLGFMAANSRRIYAPMVIVAGLLGMALIGLSGGAWSFGDPWISASFAVWFAMNGVLHAVLLPAERKLAGGDDSAARRVDAGSAIITVLLIVMLVLMIWKPGV